MLRVLQALKRIFQQRNPIRRSLQQLRENLKDTAPGARGRIANQAAGIREPLEASRERNETGFRQWLRAGGFAVSDNVLPHVVNSARLKQLWWAVIAVSAIELPLAAWVSNKTFTFGLLAASLIGIVFTAGSTGVLSLYWHATARKFRNEREKAVALLERALQRTAIVWFLLWIGLLLFSRLTDPESFIGDVAFKLLTTTLAVVTPNLLALALSLIWMLGGESRSYVAAQCELTALIREARAIEEEASVAPPEAPKLEIIYPPQVVALALVALLSALPAAAQTGGVLRVMNDVSGSPDPAALEAATEATFGGLRQLAPQSDISRIELYAFAEDSFNVAPLHIIELPDRPHEQECEVKQTERTLLFREAAEKARRAATERCRKQYELAQQAYESRIVALIEEGKRKLLGYSRPDPQKSCIADALARHAYKSALPLRGLVLITDGAENCDEGSDALRAPAGSPPAVIILLPEGETKPQERRKRFEERERYWRKRAPWLSAITPPGGFHAGLLGAGKEAR